MSLTVNGMTVEQIIEGLQIRKGRDVARATGVSHVTISRIKRGRVPTTPKYGTLEKLSRYMIDNPEEVEILRAKLAKGNGNAEKEV